MDYLTVAASAVFVVGFVVALCVTTRMTYTRLPGGRFRLELSKISLLDWLKGERP